MDASRILFVNQTGVMSGAEYVLASLTASWPRASALLLEDGPLAEVMRRQGLNVTVAPAAMQLGSIKRDNSPLAALPILLRLRTLIFRIAALGRQHDVVYANSQKAFTLCALASLMFRSKLVWHLHDILDPRHFGHSQRRMQVILANHRASAVIVPSKAAADAFVEAGGKAELVHVVPNGISLDQPPGMEREALELPKGPLIGVFSRLAPWKGQHVVLEALKLLPDVKCIFAGSALFGEDDYRAQLLKTVEESGLQERALFLGQRKDVPILMQAVDAVIHPSVDPEPFGLTLVEAMLAGTPIIATNCGASGEILDGGRAGTLVPAADPASLATTIRTFFQDRTPFEAKASAAGQRVRSVYGIEAMRTAVSRIIARPKG
ncbi:glycosyltransferase family 4 protein [Rhizobium oryzicola]|uniref:Glycosyltransferase family 4 protein n=1 Tax=Rhizobium oryzicola TaxID=1232668 RepID=A0ABT8T3I1_9HYPH|nr:glycosyltransferase family 4 protein [Rhizobium oryzicola]MDO1585251.1 glycosyltransferase family 4 protein [Rhizobium oryzicola]